MSNINYDPGPWPGTQRAIGAGAQGTNEYQPRVVAPGSMNMDPTMAPGANRVLYRPGQPGGYQGYNPGMTVQDMTRGMQAGAPIGGGGSQGAALMPYSMKPQGGFGNQQNMVRAMHDALMGGGTL
jgi:hypothetical protein